MTMIRVAKNWHQPYAIGITRVMVLHVIASII